MSSQSNKPAKKSAATDKSFLIPEEPGGLMQRWFGTGITATLASPQKRVSLLIILASSLLIFGILSSRYIFVESIISNGISTRDVVAQRRIEVENVEETQQRRNEAKFNVSPIYRKQAGTDKIILDRLINLLETISDLRQQPHLSYADKARKLKELASADDSQANVIATILSTSNWQTLYFETLRVAEALIDKGVHSDDYINRKNIVIGQTLNQLQMRPSSKKLNAQEKEAVIFMVGLKLRPTMIIDEELTDKAQQQAIDLVQPVLEVYFKGDLVARSGEKLNAVQIAAMQEQGTLVEQYRWYHIFGIFVLTISLLGLVWQFLHYFEKGRFFRTGPVGFLAVLMVASTLLFQGFSNVDSNHIRIGHMPIAILPLLVCIFIHHRVALLVTTCVLLLCSITYQIPLQSLGVLMIACLIGVFVLARKPVPKDRSDLILSGLGIGIAQGISMLAIDFIYNPGLSLSKFDFVWHPFYGVMSGLSTGVISLGLLPLIESVFNMVTSYTLLELGNHDRPILKRMQMEAPGTFHHTIMVATLAEACAEAVGANPVLTRVGTLYHDIGKMKRPLFFIENQAYFGVENPHDRLTPRLSKMVIAAHTRDGVEMGRQLKLPDILLDFMTEHHGTMIIGYFYNKAVLQEGEENVNIDQFRYAGPKPQTKETAICMLCDASESSVRALKNPTLQQLEERVEKIFRQRIDDNQFSECPITLEEIQIVKQTILRMLRAIQHERIEYQQSVMKELGSGATATPGSGGSGAPGALLENHQKLNKTLSSIKADAAPSAKPVASNPGNPGSGGVRNLPSQPPTPDHRSNQPATEKKEQTG
ncbi:MAG: HDIG domain-containing protein [Cyanobacteria bacterium HKST-UBA04]|nr:HDIG domain-containing protein [Cyanobacteria bacterium HKST-UBA04]